MQQFFKGTHMQQSENEESCVKIDLNEA